MRFPSDGFADLRESARKAAAARGLKCFGSLTLATPRFGHAQVGVAREAGAKRAASPCGLCPKPLHGPRKRACRETCKARKASPEAKGLSEERQQASGDLPALGFRDVRKLPLLGIGAFAFAEQVVQPLPEAGGACRRSTRHTLHPASSFAELSPGSSRCRDQCQPIGGQLAQVVELGVRMAAAVQSCSCRRLPLARQR